MSNRGNAGWELMGSQPKEVDHFVRMLGTGAAQPTKVEGATVNLNRTGVGVIEIIWPDFPGSYMGCKGFAFEATAQAALKGYSVVIGAFDAANSKVTINITDTADVLADLAAAQNLSLTFAFRLAPAVGV
jgi:hypothetical protein